MATKVKYISILFVLTVDEFKLVSSAMWITHSILKTTGAELDYGLNLEQFSGPTIF